MIRSIYYPKEGIVQRDLSLDQIKTAITDTTGLLWVSLEQPSESEITAILRDIFQFHPLAIEDCQSFGYQTPKVDDFGSYLFIVVHAIHSHEDLADLETAELNVFLGKNYLVTSYQDGEMSPIKTSWQRLERDARIYTRGTDSLCHTILDSLIDEYIPFLDDLDEEIETLEDRVLEKPGQNILERLLTLRHTLLTLRRVVSPQREVINRLSRDEFPQIDPQSRYYFRDIYDHLVRIQDLIESVRDVTSSAMDIYLNSIAVRQNEVMKALTIVSTIFLPLSFMAGVFGMNFEFFPEIHWPYGYLYAWGIFITLTSSMLLFFKKRGWF
jgi:magnesium transporter